MQPPTQERTQGSFANTVSLIVRTRAKNLSDTQEYLIRRLVAAWKDDHDKASSNSHRGDMRLEQHLEDNESTTTMMSDSLKNIRSYGMAEMMRG